MDFSPSIVAVNTNLEILSGSKERFTSNTEGELVILMAPAGDVNWL